MTNLERSFPRALAPIASLLLALIAQPVEAQITPPGLGNAQAAAWTAVGLRELLDSHEHSYLGYIGIGTTNEVGHDNSPYAKPAILVVNHEVYVQFRKLWLYSLGLSYRRQNAYKGEGGDTEWRRERLQELRIYGRYALALAGRGLKFQATARPELRGFVQPDFSPADEWLQLRFRLKAQLTWNLDVEGAHRLVGGAEALSSVSRKREGWTALGYRESRFSLFYSFASREHVTVDVGYMNDLLGSSPPFVDVHYLAVDLVWTNLFAGS